MSIGIHQSFENPLWLCVEKAEQLGADTFQIFLRNNRNLKRRIIAKQEIDYFNTNLLSSNIESFVVHAAYAMNPCTDNTEKRDKYLQVIKEDLKIMNMLAGNKYYVLHPGSALDLGVLEALDNLAEFLHLLRDNIGTVTIAVEYMSGAGTQVLCTPEQIEYLMAYCYDLPNIKICYDTCHAYGSGKDVVDAYRRLKQYVSVLHLNNSLAIFGSKKDRHANLNNGLIPSIELLNVAKDFNKTKSNSPIILETPGEGLLEDFVWLQKKLG